MSTENKILIFLFGGVILLAAIIAGLMTLDEVYNKKKCEVTARNLKTNYEYYSGNRCFVQVNDYFVPLENLVFKPE